MFLLFHSSDYALASSWKLRSSYAPLIDCGQSLPVVLCSPKPGVASWLTRRLSCDC